MLSKKKLQYFKKRLQDDRDKSLRILRGDETIREIRESDKLPLDEADQAQSLASQTLTYSMRKREMEKIREIEAALMRIEDGTFGICEETGDEIEERRLEVQPWTRVSLEAARELEANRRQIAANRGPIAEAI
jgi:DnaK suppressor protein